MLHQRLALDEDGAAPLEWRRVEVVCPRGTAASATCIEGSVHLNDDVVDRCPRRGAFLQLHAGRSRGLVGHHDRLHDPTPCVRNTVKTAVRIVTLVRAACHGAARVTLAPLKNRTLGRRAGRRRAVDRPCPPNASRLDAAALAAGNNVIDVEKCDLVEWCVQRRGAAFSTRRRPMATPTMLSTIRPETIKNAFKEIMDDEAQHVSFFQTALKRAGVTPRPKPTFKGLAQSEREEFIAMSSMLENAGVGAFCDGHACNQRHERYCGCGVNRDHRGTSCRLCKCVARQAAQRTRRVR
jgi:hypothetical protein